MPEKMNWITRKVRNYIRPVGVYLINSLKYFFSIKDPNTFLVLADFTAFGGTRTYFEQLCGLLKGQQKKVVCLVTPGQVDDSFIRFIKLNGLSYETIPAQEYVIEYFGKWSPKLMFSYVRKILDKVNFFCHILHQYKCTTLFISSGEPEKWLYLFLTPVKKCVYVLHTLPYRNIGKVGSSVLRERLGPNRIIVTVSDFAKASITRHWKITDRCDPFIHVISNYFEPCEDKTAVRKPEGETIVLTLGHVVSYKNPGLWIEVAKSTLQKSGSRNLQFVWAGDGNLIEACRKEVKCFERIKFIGYEKDIDTLYAKADIYLQPSQIESQGMSVIGAMYYSIPAIVSDSGGLPESVIDGVNGYVVANNDVDQYVNKVLYLLENDDLRKKMGQEGKRIFNEKFTREHWVDRINTLIVD